MVIRPGNSRARATLHASMAATGHGTAASRSAPCGRAGAVCALRSGIPSLVNEALNPRLRQWRRAAATAGARSVRARSTGFRGLAQSCGRARGTEAMERALTNGTPTTRAMGRDTDDGPVAFA